jgi:hypothetical protein
MAAQWYYGRGTDITGPISGRELADLAASGQLLPSDTIWQEGVEMGVPAMRVKNLFSPSPPEAGALSGVAPSADVSSQLLQEDAPLPPGASPALAPTEGSLCSPGVEPTPILSTAEIQPGGSPPAAPTPPSATAPDAGVDDVDRQSLEQPQAMPSQPTAQYGQRRKARATAGKGVMIVGQDGTNLKYRMKCTGCGFEDNSWKTMAITRGTTRVSFFCPKCRRRRDGEIHGVV